MDELKTVESLGISLPTPAYLFGAILFGVLGLAAFRYGRKSSRDAPKWIGVALMLYPYLISGTWQLYAVGLALCGALFYFRR